MQKVLPVNSSTQASQAISAIWNIDAKYWNSDTTKSLASMHWKPKLIHRTSLLEYQIWYHDGHFLYLIFPKVCRDSDLVESLHCCCVDLSEGCRFNIISSVIIVWCISNVQVIFYLYWCKRKCYVDWLFIKDWRGLLLNSAISF